MEDFPQPRMVVLAGPNGSGKSTVTKGLEQDERFPKLYLNADVIAKELEKPVGRVRFAHADASGLPLFEEAQDAGVMAAEAILREEGERFRSLLA